MTDNPEQAQPKPGKIFVVGGAEDKVAARTVLNRFVKAAGGSQARLVVIATPSSIPQAMLTTYKQVFSDLGVSRLTLAAPMNHGDADEPSLLEALGDATGVYFTGGDQLKLTSQLGGTQAIALLHERLAEGSVVLGGTSAGASAMSTVMIARGRAARAPRLSTVHLSPGLGFIRRVIIDQHFQERDRYGRLIAAVLHNPYMLGFGVDEDTAFILDGNGDVEIVGRGTLTIVDAAGIGFSTIHGVSASQPVAFSNLKLHVLGAGHSYNIDTRTVTAGVSASFVGSIPHGAPR